MYEKPLQAEHFTLNLFLLFSLALLLFAEQAPTGRMLQIQSLHDHGILRCNISLASAFVNFWQLKCLKSLQMEHLNLGCQWGIFISHLSHLARLTVTPLIYKYINVKSGN